MDIHCKMNSVVCVRDGSIVSVSSIISAIPILSVSYRIGVLNIGFFNISLSCRSVMNEISVIFDIFCRFLLSVVLNFKPIITTLNVHIH